MSMLDDIRKNLNCARLAESVDRISDYARVQTRLLYPDGSNIDVFIPLHDLRPVSDLGNTTTWLSHLGIKAGGNKRRQQQVESVLRSLSVRLDGGEIVAERSTGDDGALAVIRVAQACSRLADLCFTKRQQAAQFREEVEEVVSTFDLAYEAGVRLVGTTGKEVIVDLLVRGSRKSSAVICIEPAKAMVDDAAHRWFDLKDRDDQRVTVYNDRLREMDPSNLEYLSHTSFVLPFTAQDDIREMLAA